MTIPKASSYSVSSSVAPAGYAKAAVPGVAFSDRSRAIYVGGAGTVVVKMAGSGQLVTFAAVPIGTILPIRASMIDASSTATNIVVLW